MTKYIHGSTRNERDRLALMNRLINPGCLQALRLGDERRVLDMGSGTGLFSLEMARQLGPGAQVTGIEFNPAQIEVARNLDSNCATLDFRQGDAADPPLEAHEWGHFDLAHTRFLLEHVPGPQAVVNAMVRAVRPGGRVVLLDDDHDVMRLWPECEGFDALWRAYYRSYRPLGNDPLIGRKLPQLLQRAGARPARITQVFYGACAGAPEFEDILGNLAEVLAGARESVLTAGEITANAFDKALEQFQSYDKVDGSALWYVINYAEGVVSDSPHASSK